MNKFQHLKISLADVKLATKDFADCIGKGGFGKVYKGELLLSSGLTLVAVKRLDNAVGQGAPEFWREVMLLTRYKHENLVSLLGFCDEGSEKILVYEYLPNRSLDLYLASTNLSWKQRLRICLEAAHGLQYLHEPFEGSQQRILHRDIKSGNILLDQNWKAKIADFGLSKFGPANQEDTFLYSVAVGTMGYCDLLYIQTGYLTKESDVYSFGAVMFEVLCGKHCVERYGDILRLLPLLARKFYEEKKLDTVIFDSLKGQISPQCLERFSKTAYQCLQIDRTQRPSVTKIVEELEIALEYQLNHHIVLESDSDEYWERKLPRDWEVLTRILNIPQTIYNIKKELFSHLHKGILFDEGNKFFWINNDGKKCVLISAIRFLELDGYINCWVFQRDYLRFSKVADISYHSGSRAIRCQIKTSMLSLGTMYAANLVFKYDNKKPNTVLKDVELVAIKWRMEESRISSLHYAELTPDNWYKITMWHFINDGPHADFDIVLEKLVYPEYCFGSYPHSFMIQGIEFQPTEMKEDIKGIESLISPDKGDRIHCFMSPATDILFTNSSILPPETLYLSESRFGKVTKLGESKWFSIDCSISSLRSLEYSCYLVFKFKDNYDHQPSEISLFKSEFNVYDTHGGRIGLEGTTYACLNMYSVNIPTIKTKNDNVRQDDSSSLPRVELHKENPENIYCINERKDGWLELRLCNSFSNRHFRHSIEVRLSKEEGVFPEMIIEGVEFKQCIHL